MTPTKRQRAARKSGLGSNKKPKSEVKRFPKNSKRNSVPFRFLDLPAEMRNNVYEKVLQVYPEAWLSRNTAQRTLATKSGLVGVSKQVRREFLSVLLLAAPVIKTSVRNFNFSHLIAYFNRLADAELNTILSLDTAIPSERVVSIEFLSGGLSIAASDGLPIAASTQLLRWLNRVEHPTKKGTRIDCKYTVLRGHDYRDWRGISFVDGQLALTTPGSRKHTELLKILNAIKEV